MTDDPQAEDRPDGRFRKGESGNRKGRPRGQTRVRIDEPPALETVLALAWSLTSNGESQELTTEQALQHQTLKRALEGDVRSERQVLKWIEKRYLKLAELTRRDARNEKPPELKIIKEVGQRSDRALEILGIASPGDDAWANDGADRLKLATWAVQAAIRRHRKLGELNADDVTLIRNFTHNPDALQWPRTFHAR